MGAAMRTVTLSSSRPARSAAARRLPFPGPPAGLDPQVYEHIDSRDRVGEHRHALRSKSSVPATNERNVPVPPVSATTSGQTAHAAAPFWAYQRQVRRIVQAGSRLPSVGAARTSDITTSATAHLWPVHCGHPSSTHGPENRNLCSGRPSALARETNPASTRTGGLMKASLPLVVMTPSSCTRSSQARLGHVFAFCSASNAGGSPCSEGFHDIRVLRQLLLYRLSEGPQPLKWRDPPPPPTRRVFERRRVGRHRHSFGQSGRSG